VPLGLLTFLVAIAPPLPESRRQATPVLEPDVSEALFRYRPDDAVFALDFDPRKVRIDLLEGWDTGTGRLQRQRRPGLRVGADV